jgi:Mn2+/Fe2+ NRAMP family transporter
MRWQAWNTFLAATLGAFVTFLAVMLATGILYLQDGVLDADETLVLLQGLYLLGYPFVFIALGALLWHLVRFYRGDYAAS